MIIYGSHFELELQVALKHSTSGQKLSEEENKHGDWNRGEKTRDRPLIRLHQPPQDTKRRLNGEVETSQIACFCMRVEHIRNQFHFEFSDFSYLCKCKFMTQIA